MPQLVLSRSEHAVTVKYADAPVEGYPVVIAKRNPSDANQQWGFSPTGQIYSLSKPSLVLTYVGDHDIEDITANETPSQSNSPEEQVSRGLENLNFMDELELDGQMSITEGVSQQPTPSLSDQTEESTETGLAKLKDEFLGQNYSLVLLPKKQGEGTQRWAVKQEDLKNIGQWKNSTIRNPEWNKRALSWPVNEDGTWNIVGKQITNST